MFLTPLIHFTYHVWKIWCESLDNFPVKVATHTHPPEPRDATQKLFLYFSHSLRIKSTALSMFTWYACYAYFFWILLKIFHLGNSHLLEHLQHLTFVYLWWCQQQEKLRKKLDTFCFEKKETLHFLNEVQENRKSFFPVFSFLCVQFTEVKERSAHNSVLS